MKYLEGDWAMKGTDIVQITEIRDGGLTVSTGFINSSGRLGGQLYPLTLQNKAAAESAESILADMRNLCRSLNWPRIADWVEFSLCEADGDKDKQKAFLKKLTELRRELQDLQDRYFDALPDVSIFRQIR